MTVPVSDTTLTTHASDRPPCCTPCCRISKSRHHATPCDIRPLRAATLARICRNDCVGLAGERIGVSAHLRPQQQRVGRSHMRSWGLLRRLLRRDNGRGLPPGLRSWAANRQIGARSTDDQQHRCQPERGGEGDPAQQDASG
jgi:hypothetical protein